MEKSIEKIGLVNLITLLVIAPTTFGIAFYSASTTIFICGIFILMGLIVGCVNYFQMRLDTREWNERLEVEELKRVSDKSALFSTDTELYPDSHLRCAGSGLCHICQLFSDVYHKVIPHQKIRPHQMELFKTDYELRDYRYAVYHYAFRG